MMICGGAAGETCVPSVTPPRFFIEKATLPPRGEGLLRFTYVVAGFVYVNCLFDAAAARAANAAGAAGLRADADAGGDAFGQRGDVRDDADVFAVGAQLGEGV